MRKKYIAIIIASLALFTGQAHTAVPAEDAGAIEVRTARIWRTASSPAATMAGTVSGRLSPHTRRRGTNGCSVANTC